jgi:pimeloyl-ACP methyl ester carboxylesterase
MIRSAREEHRSSNGLFYRTAGKGPPVLLLHGMMATGEMFDPLTELLQDHFQLIVPDLRGHGLSQNVPRPYDVPGLAADLGPLLAEAGATRCAVLGVLSWWRSCPAIRA